MHLLIACWTLALRMGPGQGMHPQKVCWARVGEPQGLLRNGEGEASAVYLEGWEAVCTGQVRGPRALGKRGSRALGKRG